MVAATRNAQGCNCISTLSWSTFNGAALHFPVQCLGASSCLMMCRLGEQPSPEAALPSLPSPRTLKRTFSLEHVPQLESLSHCLVKRSPPRHVQTKCVTLLETLGPMLFGVFAKIRRINDLANWSSDSRPTMGLRRAAPPPPHCSSSGCANCTKWVLPETSKRRDLCQGRPATHLKAPLHAMCRAGERSRG